MRRWTLFRESPDKMQAQIEELRKTKGDRRQLELRFDDGQQGASTSESSTANGFRTSRRSGQQLASRFFQVVSEAIEIALLRVPPRFDVRTRYRFWRRGGDSNPRYKF